MQDQIERDLKTAMLAHDKTKADTLKGIKNAMQYEAISAGGKLSDEQIQKVLSSEAKKRAETAELYKQNNEPGRAEVELAEKAIIDAYLTEQLDEATIDKVVKEEVARVDSPTMADMGKIIGAVKAKLGAGADGATIARLVKQAIEQ